MTFTTVLFYILAAVLVIAAFRVITARSPVTAVLHLILAFANAAMLWMLLGAEFLALLLVLVYVGAVMVLFLFVVMMLDIRMDALRQGMKTYLPLGLVIGTVMVLEMAFVLGSTGTARARRPRSPATTTTPAPSVKRCTRSTSTPSKSAPRCCWSAWLPPSR